MLTDLFEDDLDAPRSVRLDTVESVTLRLGKPAEDIVAWSEEADAPETPVDVPIDHGPPTDHIGSYEEPWSEGGDDEPWWFIEDLDPNQILQDRPDVYAAFFREFFGPNNDHRSSAWMDRVGGDTPQDYAVYWYRTYGYIEGYVPGFSSASQLADASEGRTTADGIPIAQILNDRPDVYRSFFEQYYGAGNDRHSGAWAARVGEATPEAYAEYWYNTHGKAEGYGTPQTSLALASEAAPSAEFPIPLVVTLFD